MVRNSNNFYFFNYKIESKKFIFFIEPVAIIIPMDSIFKLLVHFGKEVPVIFVYPHPKIAVIIRELLKMKDPSNPYYDPASTTGKKKIY